MGRPKCCWLPLVMLIATEEIMIIRHCLNRDRFSVFKNRIIRRTFSSKWEEVTTGWRKGHYKEFKNL